MKNRIRIPAILLVSLWLTSGCGKEEAIVEEIRSIKTVTVKKASAGKMRRFSGVVRAVDSATLSFEVSGKIEKVNVDIGDRAEKQQVLAVLDKEPYVLNVKSAEAELIRAKANLVNKEADYQREKSIYEEGAGSKQRLDQARFGYKEAKAGIQYAVSRLNLAKRDLRKTILYAPYDSHIGRRYVNPHVEVKVGQPIFDIEGHNE